MEHERRKLNGRLSCAVCRTEDERWSSSNGKPRNQFETASSIRFNIKPTDERGAHDGTRRSATRQQVLLFLKKKKFFDLWNGNVSFRLFLFVFSAIFLHFFGHGAVLDDVTTADGESRRKGQWQRSKRKRRRVTKKRNKEEQKGSRRTRCLSK